MSTLYLLMALEELTWHEILTGIPHDAGAVFVYVLVLGSIGLIAYFGGGQSRGRGGSVT